MAKCLIMTALIKTRKVHFAMKKIISVILTLTLLIGMMAMIGCNENTDREPSNTKNVQENDKNASDPTSEPIFDSTEKPTENSSEKPFEKPTDKDEEAEEDLSGTTISIGMTAPLSGDALLYGRAVKHGVEGAIKEINEAGGIDGMLLSLNLLDDKNDPSLVGGLYDELIDAGMKISLGSVTSSCCAAFAEAAKDDGTFILTPTAVSRELFDSNRVYGMDFAEYDEMFVLLDYIKKIYDPAGSDKIGIIYSAADTYSWNCKDYLTQISGSLLDNAIWVDSEVAWDEYNVDAAEKLSKCKNIVILYPVDNITVSSLVSDVDFICREKGGKTEQFISVYTFYDFGWGIVWDSEIDAKILMPFDVMAKSGEFAEFREKYHDFHYSDAFVALGYDAVYAIYEALLEAIEQGEKISADMSAAEFGEILDGVFKDGFEFEALTGGGGSSRGTVKWHSDGRVNKTLFPVTISKLY